ncbi:hypothetical protein B0A53_00815 [Rhodotorula sp. CCFEE 5036]|nr:hypothetical protein B0A53_00815 [Rhodotorula sp. CCFEE 5036]
MGFRELVHIVGKLCKRLTRRRAHFEPTTKPTEPAEMTTIKTDVQFASPAKDDNTRTPTKGVNLDNLPTELLLAIVSAASQGWRPRLRLLATMAQVNRRLAIVLLPEARRTFHVLSGRQIETLHTLPYTIRVQCRTLFVEARPPLPDGQQSAVSTYPCPNLLPGEIPMALQLLPALQTLRFGPIYLVNDADGRYEIPEIGNAPPTLQYLQVDCALPKDFVPDLPKCFFETKTPTLFCLDYAFNGRSQPYNAEQHPMQYVRLDRLPQLSSKRSELSDFLLSLSSLRCIFLARELYDSADTCDFVNPLAQRLIARCVDVRKHIDKAVGSYVLPGFKDYLKMKQETMATA